MKKVLERIVELKGDQKTAVFARSIGINQQTMDRYLKGREPPIGVIQKLCLTYGVSADWLLGLPERGSSTTVTGNVGAVAVGAGAKATVGRGLRSAPTNSDCENCKYKRLADAFKAL